MKKTIVFVMPSLQGGGAQKVILTYLEYLDPSKYDLHLILTSRVGILEDRVPDYVEITCLHAKSFTASIMGLSKTLNKLRPDLVFATIAKVNLMVLLVTKILRKKTKIIVRESNAPSFFYNRYPKWQQKLYITLCHMLYPAADVVVALCQEMIEDMKQVYQIDDDNIYCLYNPLEIQEIEQKVQVSVSPYKQSGIHLVTVGKLTYQKGFDVLLEAFSLLGEGYGGRDIYLNILGVGKLEKDLKIQAEKLGILDRVFFWGFQMNPYPFMAYADVYILSSRYEGMGNVLLEALVCSNTIVATRCKCGPTEILVDGKYGIMTEIDNPVAMAEAIREAVKRDDSSHLRERALFFEKAFRCSEFEMLIEDVLA